MSIEFTTAFQWHPHTHVKTQANESISFKGIGSESGRLVFISDSDSTHCFAQLQYVIEHGFEFCVYPEDNPFFVRAIDSDTKSYLKGECESAYFQSLSAGSSGTPKRVLRTQASWVESFKINAAWAQISSSDSYAVLGRLSHSLPLYAALEAAYIGADIHVLSDSRPDQQLVGLSSLQSTIVYATPTQLRLLCKHYQQTRKKTQCTESFAVRYVFSGGGKLDALTRKRLAEVFSGARIIEFYGATEASFITMSDENTPDGSVGKAYPGVNLRLESTDTQPQGVGKIWIKSPYLFEGYVGINSQSAQDTEWKDGYVSVGEYGRLDAQGYLYLSGRHSRRVNIADKLVHPEEIETLILKHAGIDACAVVPIDDQYRGQVLVAVIERVRNDDSSFMQKSLLTVLREQLGNLVAPRQLFFVETLPRLASGKVDLLAVEHFVASKYENN